jgi:hypothetical protein
MTQTIDDDMAALVGFGCEAFFYGTFTATDNEILHNAYTFRVLHNSLRYIYLFNV